MSKSTQAAIIRTQVPESQRMKITADLFGINFPQHIEPSIFNITSQLCREYSGGYWEFYTLSNGGFYMAPQSDKSLSASCENGFEGSLSGDALGIAACLYAYSHLSFGKPNGLSETCAQHYHLLREYMFEHHEVGVILKAID